VIAEIALALPLLVAAGMSVLGTYRFLNGPQGYDAERILAMRLVLPEAKYSDPEARRQFTARALEELQRVSGVSRAAVANIIPALGANAGRRIEIDGKPNEDAQRAPSVDWRAVTPAYFQAMGIPMVRGRAFSTADRETSARVAIVSEAMARKFWGERSPVAASSTANGTRLSASAAA
jgi:putative ABC transport system permease protein